MNELSARDRALVGLGAAIASNSIPCVEHHLPNARKAGLSNDEIQQVLALADTIRDKGADAEAFRCAFQRHCAAENQAMNRQDRATGFGSVTSILTAFTAWRTG